jgi:hypothetical protein
MHGRRLHTLEAGDWQLELADDGSENCLRRRWLLRLGERGSNGEFHLLHIRANKVLEDACECRPGTENVLSSAIDRERYGAHNTEETDTLTTLCCTHFLLPLINSSLPPFSLNQVSPLTFERNNV